MENTQAIFARNCSVHRIDKHSAAAFLAQHHRLGATGCRYAYGLCVDRSSGRTELSVEVGTLVAVALFSNARRWDKGGRKVSSYEWIRYASLSGIRVVGGMSKLLAAFVEEVHPDDVMSYADADYPDGGEAYLKLGFVQEAVIEKNGHRNLKYRLKVNQY